MHQFFQGFIPPQQAQININPNIVHNEMIFELYNNWEFVLNIYERINSGLIQNGDQIPKLEGSWVHFCSQNGINVLSYKNKEDFLTHNMRKLINEN